MRFVPRTPLIVALLASLAASLPAQARPDAERLAAAHRLLRASGAAELMVTAMKANIPVQRTAMPQVPAAFWDRFEQRLVSDSPQFLDSIAVVYASVFTLQDLQQLVAFYESPLGRRLRNAQPEILTQSSAVGQRWGARLGAAVAQSLEP